MEAFYVSVLPGTPGLDIERLNLKVLEPSFELLGDEFWAIVRSYVSGAAVLEKQFRQYENHVL